MFDEFKQQYLKMTEMLLEECHIQHLSGIYVNSEKHSYDQLIQTFVSTDKMPYRCFVSALQELEQANPENIFCAFLPKGIVSSSGIDWLSTAAVLDFLPRRSIAVCLPYIDYADADLDKVIASLNKNNVQIAYAISYNTYENPEEKPIHDISNGHLAFVHCEDKRESIDEKRKRKQQLYHRSPEQKNLLKNTVVFEGEIPDCFVKEYLQEKQEKSEYSTLKQAIEKITYSSLIYQHRQEMPPLDEFVSVISLGTFKLPEDLETRAENHPDLESLDKILDKSNLLKTASDKGASIGLATASKVEGYLKIWENEANKHGLTLSRTNMRRSNDDHIKSIASFMGIDSMISALSNGVALDDILA